MVGKRVSVRLGDGIKCLLGNLSLQVKIAHRWDETSKILVGDNRGNVHIYHAVARFGGL